MSIRKYLLASVGIVICGPVFSTVAWSAEDAVDMPEIVVTANKREQSIQRVPLAITALGAETLQRSNIVSLTDMNGFVPGLTSAPINGLQRVIAIRGVGYETAQNASSQPGVAFNIDQAYISNNMATGVDLFDVERVEVARGPQGTVYGQNATGGVVNVVLKQAKLGTTSANVDISYGSYNLVQANAGFNLPIGETLAVRAAGHVYRHDGWAHVPALNNYDLDNASNVAARVAFLWEPAPQFSLTGSAQIWNQKSNGPAQKNILDPNPDIRELSYDYAGSSRLDFELYNLTANYDAGFARFKLIGTYQDMDTKQTADNDRLDFATLGRYDVYQPFTMTNKAKTLELNITSRPDARLSWILGGYGLWQKARQIVVEFAGTGANPTFPNLTSAAGGLPANFAYSTNNYLKRDSWAAFGQLTYELVDGLRVTGGLRYSEDNFSNIVANNFATVPVSYSQNDKTLTGKAMVEYDVAPSILTYVSYSRGYKPGGVNINTRPVLVGRTFEGEKVNAYEVGLKGTFLDGNLTFNTAGFVTDYKNFQYQEEDPIPYQGGVANVPKARTWGAEFEASARLTPDLRFNGNLTWLDGKFSGTYFALDALAANRANAIGFALGYGLFSPAMIALRAAQVANTDGNKPPKMPGLAGTAGLEHSLDIGGGALITRAEVVYRGKYQFRIFNSGGIDEVPAYTLVNLNFRYQPANSPVTIGLAATNLLQSKGISARFSDPFGVGSTSNTYVPPRQIIGSINFAM